MAACALAGIASFGASPARAETPWEIGCAYRSQPTGYGELNTRYFCDRYKECQLSANSGGGMPGCIGFQPAPAGSNVPERGRVRGPQQQ